MQKCHDLDNIYNNLDSPDIKPAMKKKLEAGRESAYMSLMLGTIRTDAPIDTELEHYIVKERSAKERSEAARLMARLELYTLIKKFGLDNTEPDTTDISEDE